MRTYDLSPLMRATIGFDRLTSLLDTASRVDEATLGYPPYNIEKTGDERGIATRAFERRFDLADHIQVTGARLENGILWIDLAREVPEAMKPRTIAIETQGKAKVIESAAA
jgi:molecular chaperone IbpA